MQLRKPAHHTITILTENIIFTKYVAQCYLLQLEYFMLQIPSHAYTCKIGALKIRLKFFFLCALGVDLCFSFFAHFTKANIKAKVQFDHLEILWINVAKFMYKFGADIHRVMGDY